MKRASCEGGLFARFILRCLRLSELERETKDLKNKNSIKESDLQNLVVVLEEHRADLQRAASRTISLRKILEDMRLRRQAANAAALVEHRKMQQDAATVVIRLQNCYCSFI